MAFAFRRAARRAAINSDWLAHQDRAGFSAGTTTLAGRALANNARKSREPGEGREGPPQGSTVRRKLAGTLVDKIFPADDPPCPPPIPLPVAGLGLNQETQALSRCLALWGGELFVFRTHGTLDIVNANGSVRHYQYASSVLYCVGRYLAKVVTRSICNNSCLEFFPGPRTTTAWIVGGLHDRSPP